MKITIDIPDGEIVKFLSANPAILQKIADSGVEKRRKKKPQLDCAKTLIYETLLNTPGMPAKDLEFMAEQVGISKTTLHRAKGSLGIVETFRVGFGPGAEWHWKITEPEG